MIEIKLGFPLNPQKVRLFAEGLLQRPSFGALGIMSLELTGYRKMNHFQSNLPWYLGSKLVQLELFMPTSSKKAVPLHRSRFFPWPQVLQSACRSGEVVGVVPFFEGTPFFLVSMENKKEQRRKTKIHVEPSLKKKKKNIRHLGEWT